MKTGRPHWIVADEAHHLMPEPWSGAPLGVPRAIESMLLITVHPGQVAAPVLAAVDGVVAVGPTPGPIIQEFAEATGHAAPALLGNARFGRGAAVAARRRRRGGADPHDPLAQRAAAGTCASTPRVS